MPKTLMSYPRLSYGFIFILYLNEHFYSPISDCAICVNAGGTSCYWKHFGTRVGVQRAGRNVAMLGQQR